MPPMETSLLQVVKNQWEESHLSCRFPEEANPHPAHQDYVLQASLSLQSSPVGSSTHGKIYK